MVCRLVTVSVGPTVRPVLHMYSFRVATTKRTVNSTGMGQYTCNTIFTISQNMLWLPTHKAPACIITCQVCCGICFAWCRFMYKSTAANPPGLSSVTNSTAARGKLDRHQTCKAPEG